jgi:hypothetical protein
LIRNAPLAQRLPRRAGTAKCLRADVVSRQDRGVLAAATSAGTGFKPARKTTRRPGSGLVDAPRGGRR